MEVPYFNDFADFIADKLRNDDIGKHVMVVHIMGRFYSYLFPRL